MVGGKKWVSPGSIFSSTKELDAARQGGQDRTFLRCGSQQAGLRYSQCRKFCELEIRS